MTANEEFCVDSGVLANGLSYSEWPAYQRWPDHRGDLQTSKSYSQTRVVDALIKTILVNKTEWKEGDLGFQLLQWPF